MGSARVLLPMENLAWRSSFPAAGRRFAAAGTMRVSPRVLNILQGLTGIGLAIAAWEIVRAMHVVDPRDLPLFAAIVRTAAAGLFGGDLGAALLATIGA